MELHDISMRCYREVNASKTLPMLQVAYKYYQMFYNLLVRKHVEHKIITQIDQTMIKAYRRKERSLS